MQIVLRRLEDAALRSGLIRDTGNAKQRDGYRAVELAIAGGRVLVETGHQAG